MLGLSFLAPAFLLGAAVAAVPIILHLLRQESAPDVPFSAVRFLKPTPVERAERRRLRDLLLLALRVTALVLLAVAFARPYRALAGAGLGGVTIVAVDRSFSLGAPGQFARATELAREAVRTAPVRDVVGLIAFDDEAELTVEPSPDRGAALAAIGRLAAGFGATRYRPMLSRAAEAIGARRGRIVVVSDLQRGGWQADDQMVVPESVAVEVRSVDGPAGNLAVTGVERRPGETVATVGNSGGTARATAASLLVDGRVVATQAVNVPSSAASEVRFPLPLPATGAAVVTVEDAEGYLADNARHFVLDPPETLAILAVTASGDTTTEALYLERALLAGGDTRRFALKASAAAALGSRAADAMKSFAAIVLLSTRGLDRRGRELLADYARQGGGLLLVVGPDIDPAVAASLVPETRLAVHSSEMIDRSFAPADVRHPIFRPFGALAANLGQIRFHRAAALSVAEAAQTIARFDDGSPALVEWPLGDGRLLVFGSDLNNSWNDFPRHPLFVPFVHEVVRYLAKDRAATRDLLVAQAPANVAGRPGVVMMGEPPRRVAINVDLRESETVHQSAEEFQAAIGRLKGGGVAVPDADDRRQESEQAFWRYGLLAMMIVLIGEGLLGRRMAWAG